MSFKKRPGAKGKPKTPIKSNDNSPPPGVPNFSAKGVRDLSAEANYIAKRQWRKQGDGSTS
jgi:hypothetical protein